MLFRILVLFIAASSLWEIRRQERQISTRFFERGKEKVPENDETAKEDERSLGSALHSSKVGLWVILVVTSAEFIHSLFTHE